MHLQQGLLYVFSLLSDIWTLLFGLGYVVPPTVSEGQKAAEDLMNPFTSWSPSQWNSQWRLLNTRRL